MNHINPAHCTEALVELMCGGIPVGRIGYPLHCRLRYFDLDRRRAGLPEQLAALVESMDATSVTVSLANCSATAAQTVVLQGGAYGEHALTAVQAEGSDAVPISDADGLGNSAFAVRKPPNLLRAAEATFCASCEPVCCCVLSIGDGGAGVRWAADHHDGSLREPPLARLPLGPGAHGESAGRPALSGGARVLETNVNGWEAFS